MLIECKYFPIDSPQEEWKERCNVVEKYYRVLKEQCPEFDYVELVGRVLESYMY